MNGSAKTIAIQSTEKLLELFAQDLAFEESTDLSIRPSLISGLGELRIEAQNRKTILPIRPRLHASRQWLTSTATKADPAPELILAPHVPEPLAADLRRAGLNHADLNGRLFLKIPGLLLDRAPRSHRYRSSVTAPDLFSAKTSRLVRTLLAHRDRRWTQEELTARTGLSRGLVSRVLGTLQVENYVAREGTGTRASAARYALSDFDRLLDAWKTADQWWPRVQVRQFSVLAADISEVAASTRAILQNKEGEPQGVFTQWFAAHLRHAYTTPPLVSVYVKSKAQLDLPFGRRVETGGNLWLIVPEDEGVFQETQEVAGFPLVSDIQIYLDLLQVGQRGPDQADALRQWESFAR